MPHSELSNSSNRTENYVYYREKILFLNNKCLQSALHKNAIKLNYFLVTYHLSTVLIFYFKYSNICIMEKDVYFIIGCNSMKKIA